MADYPNLAFVEFEVDNGDPPVVSYFVEATPEQQDEILAFLSDHLEEWQNPYVGRVESVPFEGFINELKENWGMDDEEEDDAPDPAGD